MTPHAPTDLDAHPQGSRTIGGACGHDQAGRICNDAGDVRHYLSGNRCPRHTPAALAGRPEHHPDPAATLEGIAAAAGRPVRDLGPLPLTPREGTTLAARAIRKTRNR